MFSYLNVVWRFELRELVLNIAFEGNKSTFKLSSLFNYLGFN